MREKLFCSALTAVDRGVRDPTLSARAAMLSATFWGRGRTLTVGFIGGDPVVRDRVARIADEWLKQVNLRFHFWTDLAQDPSPADIRVGFEPGRGSWSWVGNQAAEIERTEPTMNLGWLTAELDDASARQVILHEFGHALGLIHEHLHPLANIRWRRDQVIQDLRRTQNWDDSTIEANMFNAPDPSGVFATDPDPQSIMMYPIPATWTEDGFSVGWNSALTAKDRLLVQTAYGVAP